MADKTIWEYPTLMTAQPDDLILMASDEETYNMEVQTLKDAMGEAASKPPIVRNGNWWTWSAAAEDYVDSGTAATGPRGPKGDTGDTGDTGEKGDTGDTGPAAGFGTVSATVDGNTGTPSVEVTSSGPDTAKSFSFAFHNLKGPTGDVTPAAQQAASDAAGSAAAAATSAQDAEDTAAEIEQKLDKASAYGEVGPVAIASIQDALPLDAVKLVVDIEPVQDLHGYENPWPAGGGKNKLPPRAVGKDTGNGVTVVSRDDGSVVMNGTTTAFTILSISRVTLEAGSYVLSGANGWGTSASPIKRLIALNGETILGTEYGSGVSFTLAERTAVTVRIDLASGAAVNNAIAYPMIRLASETDATFAPYSNICPISGWTGGNVVVSQTTDAQDGTTYPISWQTEAGTVYGGTLDVVNGVLTVDRGNIASYAGETLPGAWISSMDVYTAGGTPTIGAQVAYKLDTPITYQLTPQQVALLQGQNNVWADCGDTTVGFWRDDSLSINKAIAERAYGRQQGEALADKLDAIKDADETTHGLMTPAFVKMLNCLSNHSVYAAIPRWLRFDSTNKKGLIIKAGTHILKANGEIAHYTADTQVDLSGDISANGTDYGVYLLNDGTIKAATTAPSGSVEIGRFHTLCAYAGSMNMTAPAAPSSGLSSGSKYLVKGYREDTDPDFYAFYNKTISAVTVQTQYDVITCPHPLSGFSAGDILPESVFCLSFHPETLYEDAMVYDVDTGRCIDIYLQSGSGHSTRSAYNGTHRVSKSQWNHQEDMRMVGKRLLRDCEFTSAAIGSNERTNITGSSDKTYVGGHVDTNNRRMISAIGCEDMCGYLWQWLDEIVPVGKNTSGWQTGQDGHDSFGHGYGDPYVLVAGGDWASGANDGSRSRFAIILRSSVISTIGGRGSSRVSRLF